MQVHKIKKNRIHIKSKCRFIIFLTIIVVGIATFMLTFLYPAKAQSNKENEAISVYVEQGDTLWGLSKKYIPEKMDVRKYIEIVKEQNGLTCSDINVGQILQFPKY